MLRLQSSWRRAACGFPPLKASLVTAVVALLGTSAPHRAAAVSPAPLRAPHGAVASDHVAASAAGVDAMKAGGNAVDAACATALALGVVVPHSSGIGGGGFALIYLAKERKTVALDFRETAPAAIKSEMFIRDGKPDTALSQRGGLAVAVPGEVRGLSEMVKRWGRLPWARCVALAEKLARGVPASERVAWMINGSGRQDPNHGALMDQVFTAKRPVKPGDLLRRPKLAATLARLRQKGPDAFYEGPIATAIAKAVRDAGGVMTVEDLARYQIKERTPLETTYRGKRVLTMPPPSSGGIVIDTALGIIAEKVPDPGKLGQGSSSYLHIVTEALKHGFADRARHLGDPDFVELPMARLGSPAYHHELAARVRDDKVLASEQYGTPGADPVVPKDGGTAHLSVIDADGNAVALTTTVNLWFGARLVAGDTGIVLNDQMDDFSIRPGTFNAFKLLGTDKNAVAAGKRPLSSMSPTIVLDGDAVKLAVGGAGGPTIISGTLQTMLGVLDFGLDAQAASSSPRIHHQWMPETLMVEPQIPRDVLSNLEKRGHKLKERDHISSVNIVVKTDKGVEAASELRSGGAPAGY